MAETYGIRDLAREFGVTTRTIRFYEDKGLLAPVRQGQRPLSSLCPCASVVKTKP